ncbi:GNAT family N-acetyltransferase [Microbacterium sp. RD1]|uniref:GNAT family N-acetyltransferase n=1 Tax=Microbacterium sp. RD1 TaxID=3457313 RepID=UPI003FA55368
MASDSSAFPLDPVSRDALAAEGLTYERVDVEGPGFAPFLRAVARGFLDPAPTPEQIEDSRDALRARRLTGVFDPQGTSPLPVATVDSWVTELTTEPGRTVPMWAISAVTVAPTHRRRGIARAMLTGELRAAAAAGLALAGLTVTEATIYGRWGFGPAAFATDVTVDATRVRWSGRPARRPLGFVDQADLPERLSALHDRVRMLRGGQVAGWPALWRRMAGLRPGAEDASRIRAVAVRGDAGADAGILVYTVSDKDGYTRQELSVHALFAVDDDAYAELWRFALEHDLVAKVTASLQPVDSALRWSVSDSRAVRETLTDHHWLRVLDVPAALGARSYAAALSCTVRVVDPLGPADGTWRLEIDDAGTPSVTPHEGVADLVLPVSALGSLLLGGVSARTLAAAGVVTAEATAVAAFDTAFAPAVPPTLSTWY